MKLKYLPILFMSILALVSCSDDDDDPVVAPVESETVFAESNLKFTYSGAEVSDKEVLFTPDANDVTAATIVIRDITTKAENANGTKIFNGEKEVTFPIVMEITGDMGVFGGSAESKYYTFEYRGNVHEEILQLEIINVNRNENLIRPLENEKTFSGKELNLKVSGNNILGKNVCFTPDANDPFAATLTFRGDKLNLEELMNQGNRAEASGFKTSSVFAGEPEVKLPITMTLDGNAGIFEGNGESKYYTYNYKGTVLDSQLSIELSDVLLKNNKLAGTAWNLAPVVVNDWGMVESVPTNIIWESDSTIAVEMFGQTTNYSMTQLMAVVMSIGIVPGPDGKKLTIPEILVSMLQGVQFENDGNLIATYVDMKTMQPRISPKGLAQYVVVDDNNMKLVLNPFAIAADAQANKDDADKQPSEIAGMMQALAPTILTVLDADKRLSEGIDIKYTMDADKLYVNIDETLLLPVLKMFAPMLQNPELIKAIVEKVKQNPDMAAMAPMLESLLKQFPAVVETTTKMEIGLNFIKK